jgi:hypothetical protein
MNVGRALKILCHLSQEHMALPKHSLLARIQRPAVHVALDSQ